MDSKTCQKCMFFLDGGNSAFVIGVLVEPNFEASKTLFLKAFGGD